MEEMEIYKNLMRTIRNKGELDYLTRKYFIDYVSDIKDGKRNNDFYEIDFLNKIILEHINSRSNSIIHNFENTINIVKKLLPLGLETEEYNIIKNMIINDSGDIDIKLYSLFDNRLDYIQLSKIIKSDPVFLENYDSIINYAIDVSPYCINQNELKLQILAYINGLKSELDDIENYSKKRLDEARWKSGIYDIDEKKIALIANEVRQAKALVLKLDKMKNQVDLYSDMINSMTKKGKLEINEHTNSKIQELDAKFLNEQNELQKKLDDLLQTLELQLRNSKDQVIDQIINDAAEQLREIKRMTTSLSANTTSQLLRIKKASEDSVEKLRGIIDGPELRQMLKESADYEGLRESLSKFEELMAKKVENEKLTVDNGQAIYIAGNDRIVTPANPKVVLPRGEINYKILPALDESIPFNIRFEKIMAEKKRREANGELFHEMIDEILICIMEGDWPYLWGPSGCGKSHIIKQLASLLGIGIIENGKITDKYSIMAYNDPHGRFRATQTFIALVYGLLLSLDEFDNGNPDTQVVLNELYSGLLDVLENPSKKRYVTFAEDMVVPINPNFRMISAGNTSGEGENQLFSSRGKIDESVLQRQVPIFVNYDNRVEKRIFGKHTNWYNFAATFRKACVSYANQSGLKTAPGMITTRDVAAIVKYINHNSKSVDQIMMEKFVQIKNPDYLNAIIRVMENTYNISRNEGNVDIGNTSLGKVSEKVLARKLVYNCMNNMRE